MTKALIGWLKRIGACCAAIAVVLALGGTAVAAQPCQVGAYRLADGNIVDIGRSSGGLRWRNVDGTTGKLTLANGAWTSTAGWTGRPDGLHVSFGPCDAGAMDFGGISGRRIGLEVKPAAFTSHGVALQGRLILPPGTDPVPIVVLLQGSERDSAQDFDALQRLFPAMGVGAFVYDKRGTGASGGTYTQDFSLLADDAVAALATARKLAGGRAARIGFQGPSQGGWVAPIAASRSKVDFVIVSFGLAVSVFDEDQEAIAFQMSLKGHGPEVIAKAQEIGAAAGALFASDFTRGYEALEAVREKYRAEPWYGDVYGNFTHVFLSMTSDQIRAEAPNYRWGTPLRYDPLPTLAALNTPQLWVLGGQDLDAPSGETVRRLEGLIAQGKPISVAVYPMAEHGMTAFETTAEGERQSTRYAEGYFRLMHDFARDGRICPLYGDAQLKGRAAAGDTPCAVGENPSASQSAQRP